MASKHDNTTPGRAARDGLPGQPDTNTGAPRPARRTDKDPAGPDMDRPPPMRPQDRPGFDSATAAADREARAGTLPGPQERGPAQSPRGDAGKDSGAAAARQAPKRRDGA